jgi:hypothetical protein
MFAHIEDRDRYGQQTDKDVFVIKLCARVRAVDHLLIVSTGQRLGQTVDPGFQIGTPPEIKSVLSVA